jgi:hypothetical protein
MNKGLHTCGYLPHWDFKNAVQAVTFRRQDFLPSHLIRDWRRDIEEIEDHEVREKELRCLAAK